MSRPIMTDPVQGMFLSFTEDELKSVHDMLHDEGYTSDMDGLKAWILDCAEEEDEEERPRQSSDTVLSNIQRYVLEHPEKIVELGDRVGRTMEGFVQGVLRKRKAAGTGAAASHR